jgi:hypothetical protein
VLFQSNRDGNEEIYTINPNGRGVDRLTNNPANDSEPDWQPLSPLPNPKPPDNTTAPKVISTFPKANATGVSPIASLRATFSKKMQSASVKSAFKLFKKKASTKLSATVTYAAATKKATLNPTNSLRRGLTYQAVGTTRAKDVAGDQLDQNTTTSGLQQKVWSFTVRK